MLGREAEAIRFDHATDAGHPETLSTNQEQAVVVIEAAGQGAGCRAAGAADREDPIGLDRLPTPEDPPHPVAIVGPEAADRDHLDQAANDRGVRFAQGLARRQRRAGAGMSASGKGKRQQDDERPDDGQAPHTHDLNVEINVRIHKLFWLVKPEAALYGVRTIFSASRWS